jgi:hypothetical protein
MLICTRPTLYLRFSVIGSYLMMRAGAQKIRVSAYAARPTPHSELACAFF